MNYKKASDRSTACGRKTKAAFLIFRHCIKRNSMQIKKISAFVMSFILIFSMTSSHEYVSAAKSISELKQALNENAKKKQEAIKEKVEKQTELNSAVEKKNDLDIQLTALQDDIDVIDDVINDKQKEIDEKSKQIDELSDKIDDSKDTLKERMKIMYENGSTSYLEMIFESKGLSDLFTRVAIIQDIISHDKNMIQEYVNTKSEIEDTKKAVESEQAEQKEAKDMLVDKKSDLKEKQAERDKIVNQLQSEVTELEKFEEESAKYEEQARNELAAAIAAQEAAEKAAAEKAAKAKAASSSSSNSSGGGTVATAAKATSGGFGWPSAASTRVTSEFNPNRKNPVTGKWRKHTGMDIGAPQGTDVLASKAGTVVTAGWNNGYGNYITINHGNGVATLYGHNSKLLVKAGDKVEKGQVIAKVGSTGNSTGPHIHFEIIVNGTPQNPRNYL